MPVPATRRQTVIRGTAARAARRHAVPPRRRRRRRQSRRSPLQNSQVIKEIPGPNSQPVRIF